MNTADKKRIEEMLRSRATDALYRGEDAIKHPKPEMPVGIRTRLDTAAENMKPSLASVDRMAAAVEAAKQVGFSIHWTRPRKSDFEWSGAPEQSTHPALIAYQQAKLDNTTAVRNARDEAILALWSSDEFNIQVYFERIDTSTG